MCFRLGLSYNLGQIKGVVADCVEDQILQLVDSSEQIVTEGSHDSRLCLVDSKVSESVEYLMLSARLRAQ